MAEEFRVKEVAAFAFWLLLLIRDAVSISPCILSYTSDLPGYFNAGLVRLDDKGVAGDLGGDNGLRKLADRCELVTEVAIKRLKVVRHRHDSLAVRVRCHVAIVDVLHVWRLDEGVRQVLILRIERMIDL